jgi:hypothetical protein
METDIRFMLSPVASIWTPNVPFSGAPFTGRPLQRMVGRRSYDSN